MHFIAAFQVLIYVGAVMVFMVYAIMLLELRDAAAARFSGLLLPGLAAAEAQQVMTRLQRSLSEALFLHEGREVFVTFSGGVTAWRPGEALQTALERADGALYEAKRTGKNRTCIG